MARLVAIGKIAASPHHTHNLGKIHRQDALALYPASEFISVHCSALPKMCRKTPQKFHPDTYDVCVVYRVKVRLS